MQISRHFQSSACSRTLNGHMGLSASEEQAVAPRKDHFVTHKSVTQQRHRRHQEKSYSRLHAPKATCMLWSQYDFFGTYSPCLTAHGTYLAAPKQGSD